MKTKFILYLLLCLLMPSLAQAGDIKTDNFPKDKGPVVYGATMKDEYGPLHYVMFHTNDPKITKLGRVDLEDDGTHLHNLRCGAFCGDKYYGYIVNVYSYVEEPKSFGTVDFNTGEFSVIKTDYNKAERVSWPTLYEMTYDNTNNVCYALGRNMDGLFVSDLYKIDLTDGSYEMLTTLDFYAWAMACDYEGNIYMIKGIPDKKNEYYCASSIVRIDQNDSYAEKDEKRIKVEGKDYIPNYSHSMEFDHDTNKLHWLGMSNDGWQKMFDLDVKTGKAVQTANMMYNMVVGMYIPFSGADNRLAAGMVTDLNATPASDGSLKATLDWVNPTDNWMGGKLETMKSVTVAKSSRDNVIATIDAANGMGSKMSYTDENADKGYNVYYVTAQRLDGENGLTDSVRVFVGADAPGRPQNVTATVDGKNVIVSWQAPEKGAHGEKYDLASTVYEVTRMPDNVVIASNLKETTFTDTEIGTRKLYSYVVKASNNEGEGLSEESAQVIAGSAYALPFKEMFDTELCKTMWSVLDLNFDGITFEWAGGELQDFFRYQVWLNNQHDTNDMLITPPLATKAGGQYRVNFDVQVGRMEDLHKFVLVSGNAPTIEGMTNRADSVENLKCESYNQIMSFEQKFTASSSESYVGINCMSAASATESYFAVRNFRVEEIFAKDLAVKNLGGAKDLIADQPVDIIVNVRNMGYENIDSYKVEVITRDAEGNISVIGSTDVKEALEADKTAEITVAATGAAEGETEVSPRVIAEGDMNSSNDIYEWNMFKVNPKGTGDWNILIEGEKNGVSTTEPMTFYYEFCTEEHIYLKDEIKAEKDGKITRIAYQYSDNGIQAETEPVNVRIYMANTDRTGYEEQAYIEDWTPADKAVLVCEKTVTVVPGQDNMMVFDLDTPFDYDHTKNLSIQVWKDGVTTEIFPALFKTFDFGWDVYRGLRYESKKMEFAYEEGSKFFPVNNIPVLHMAVDFEDHSGIFEVNGECGMSYNNGVLAIKNGILGKVTVTDIAGRTVYSENVNAAEAVISLGAGIYVIKAADGEGNVHVLKVSGK